ncbi:hypothetical protein [Vibrio aquaticus]|uniref:hypothetical protein n=1 Tax=Vibrio aquaticus TaxID=2496559 RepID=UPI001ABF007D|nr:hypothetical protein [Vibrio aquaticus]
MNYETLVTRCNPTLDTPIPVAIDFYIDVKAQYHKYYLISQKYRHNRISSYFSAMTIKSLTVDSKARERIYEFVQWRLKKVKHGTVRKDMQVLPAFLNWGELYRYLAKRYCIEIRHATDVTNIFLAILRVTCG